MKNITLIISLCFSVSVLSDVAVIVHPNNPISALSQKEIQRLFLGRMHMFPNSTTKVESVDQKEGSRVYQDFYRKVIKMSAAKLKRYRAYYLFSGKGKLPSATRQPSVVDHVSTTENAISYVHVNDVNDRVKVVYTH